MDNDEMLKHFNMMKKCKAFDNKVAYIYIILCGLYALGTFFLMFLGIKEGFGVFFDGVISKLGILASGYLACYKHNNKFLFFALAFALLAVVLAPVNILVASVVILLSIATSMNNKTYHYLEKQPGFPVFSERFEQQNFDTTQRKIKDQYQQNYEEYLKTSSNEMNDIDFSCRPDTSGTNKFDNSGKMDEI